MIYVCVMYVGLDQLDQLNRIVNVLGMVPQEMVAASPTETRNIVSDDASCNSYCDVFVFVALQFFDKFEIKSPPSSPSESSSPLEDAATATGFGEETGPLAMTTSESTEDAVLPPTKPTAVDRRMAGEASSQAASQPQLTAEQEARSVVIVDPATNVAYRYVLKAKKSDDAKGGSSSSSKRERPPPRTIEEIVGVTTGGPNGRRSGEAGHSEANYLVFVDFLKYSILFHASSIVNSMCAFVCRTILVYQPKFRSSPGASLTHPYVLQGSETAVASAENSQSQAQTASTSSTQPSNPPPPPPGKDGESVLLKKLGQRRSKSEPALLKSTLTSGNYQDRFGINKATDEHVAQENFSNDAEGKTDATADIPPANAGGGTDGPNT